MKKNLFASIFVPFTASLGGFLFGYYLAALAGVLKELVQVFTLSSFETGLLVSSLILGALFGAIGVGSLANLWGRKKIMVLNCLLWIGGTFIFVNGESFFLLILGRVLCGIGVGSASVVCPLYLGEIAPPHLRGRYVSLFQLMLATGILLAYAAQVGFKGEDSWKMVNWISLIPVGIHFFSLFFIPEIPTWEKKHRRFSPFSKSWSFLFQTQFQTLIWIGVGLSILQQITGINTVIFYAPLIFQKAGLFTHENALFSTLWIGVFNWLATWVAVLFLDKIGRRRLLLTGVIGMAFFLGGLALFSGGAHSNWAILFTIGYVCCFSLGIGPITWVLLAELYPLPIRSEAMSLAIFANWLFNYLVALTFPFLIEEWGTGGTFTLYSLLTVGAAVFIYRFIPETKGKLLD